MTKPSKVCDAKKECQFAGIESSYDLELRAAVLKVKPRFSIHTPTRSPTKAAATQDKSALPTLQNVLGLKAIRTFV